jgi:hypothetical protein
MGPRLIVTRLDFAKINNLTNSINSKKRQPGGKEGQTAQVGQLSAFNFADMVEEVVDCVFAGHSHQNSASSLYYMTEGTTKELRPSRTKPGLKKQSRVVGAATLSALENTMIIVDVAARQNWAFCSHPGAWKRILMNLFGNALKYTQKGSILISLRCEQRSDGAFSPNQSQVILTVQDTGRGISDEYLKHRLFKPFSQENDLSIGTGLGLSIVKQIASTMGAKVSLKSEVGVGTRVEVSALLDQAAPGHCPSSHFQSVLSNAASKCRDRSLSLVGFDLLPEMTEPVGVMDTLQQQLLFLKSALSNLATEWLGMKIVPESSLDNAAADALIVHESHLGSVAHINSGEDENGRPRSVRPTIVLCCRFGESDDSVPGRIYLHHP